MWTIRSCVPAWKSNLRRVRRLLDGGHPTHGLISTQVLTDILGIEDALGGMDFKVAGSRDGISAFQLDVKELGLKAATLEKALAQAREARLHVLDEMAARGVDEPQQLSDSVPKTKTLQVEPAKIGKIIGKGGETIRGLIADHCA